MGIKRLTLADLERSGPKGSVWLLNSIPSSEIRGTDGETLRGDIIISIPKTNGDGGDPLIIKQTWLPMDASEHFPKARLLDSAEFRGAVRKGLIVLIEQDAAETILGQDGAKEERQRLLSVAKHVKQAGASRKISDSNVDMYVPDSQGRRPVEDDDNGNPAVDVFGPEDDNLARVTAGGLDLDEDGFKPSFKMFADGLPSHDDTAALNEVRTHGKFTKKELRYLRDKVKTKPKTYAHVKERLAAFSK